MLVRDWLDLGRGVGCLGSRAVGGVPDTRLQPGTTVVMNLSRLLGLPGVGRTATLPPRTARSAHSGRTSRRSGRSARSKTRTSVRHSSHRNKKVCLEFICS